MSGQVSVGWAVAPFGLKEVRDGKIRIIAKDSDSSFVKGQTLRVMIVNAQSWETKRDAILRFVKAYRETIDYMYANTKPLAEYAHAMNIDEETVWHSISMFNTKDTMQTKQMVGINVANVNAVEYKYISKPLTKEQLEQLVIIPK